MYYEVAIAPDDGRAVSYVRKETFLALYIRANDEKEAEDKLELFKRLFPHPTYAKPQKMWTMSGWMVFMACPEKDDVVWHAYNWHRDATTYCSINIADMSLDQTSVL